MARIRTPIVIAAAGCAVLIAACGSSEQAERCVGPPVAVPCVLGLHAFARRAELPGPESRRRRFHLSAGSGINPFSPSFKSAQASCSKLLPGGGPANHKPTEQDKEAMLRISQCMRDARCQRLPRSDAHSPVEPRGLQRVDQPRWGDPRGSEHDRRAVAGLPARGRRVRLPALRRAPFRGRLRGARPRLARRAVALRPWQTVTAARSRSRKRLARPSAT